MKTAAIAKLKASLSEYLDRVKAGEEVVVTDRGKPFARIVPLRREEPGLSPHLRNLERAGLVRGGSGKIPGGFWRMPRPADPKGAGVAALREERESGR
ncbi:MAG: type II toxin-antitoxin system prevent-host-death family antitoxin [Deltaproteobacteria bacterium]|nr:type II toxin-antitoxin system prevent-host-death family antitoxin [Deltaproteobacteria bacterium]